MVDFGRLRSLFELRGKVGVVTGAASGIDQAIAYAYAANGGRVVASDIDEEGLSETSRTIRTQGWEAESFKADVRSVDEVRALLDFSCRTYGKIDTLYVVPGINVRKRISEYTYEEFDRVVDLNFKSAFILMKECAPILAKNPEGGSIVVVSSIRHLVVEPGQSVYAATKAAVVQLAKTLAAELGPAKVRVNAIAPGVVDTPLTAQIKSDREWCEAYTQKTALKRWASVEEVAGPAVFLATPAASYITGSVIYVDGGWTSIDGRFEPKL